MAFRQLVEPHLRVLYRIAARLANTPQEAEDAVQETLVIAWRRLGRFEPGKSLAGWLSAIAARRAHTLARSERRRRKRRSVSAEDEGMGAANPERELQATRTVARLRAAIADLPDRRREAVLLRMDAGLDHSEIAVAMGMSEGASRVLVHRALGQLRERLGDEG